MALQIFGGGNATRPKVDAKPNPFKYGTFSPSNVLATGYDAVDGKMFYKNSTNLFQSTDSGTTISGAKSLPPGVTNGTSVSFIERFGNYLWAIATDAGDGLSKVYRAAPVANATDFTWSAALLTLTANATGFETAVSNDGAFLFVGEYSDPTGKRPKLSRITLANANGAGTTWATVWQPTIDTRHIHTVFCDPYEAGSVWLAVGDGQGLSILRSADNGDNWTTLQTSADYQAVQFSSDSKWVYAALDTPNGTAVKFDRATRTPRHVSQDYHANLPVPGGYAKRSITDGVIASGTAFTSATANFTQADKGRRLMGPTTQFGSQGNWIASVTNSTTAVLGITATAGTALPIDLLGDFFYGSAFYGIVDPATGIYYWIANNPNATNGGNVYGVGYVDPNGTCVLLQAHLVGAGRAFLAGGYLHFHRYRFPLVQPLAV